MSADGGWRNGDEWRNALDALEHRVERQIRQALAPIAENVKDIRILQQQQNGRVGRLEEDRIRRDAGDIVRAEMAQAAVENAATAAAAVVASREWSARKWSIVIAIASVSIAVISLVTSLLAHSITAAH